MKDIDDLLSIMQALRDPDKGCPWDKEQDFDSIASYTLQEVYEVVDAIQRKHMQDLKEELGDLLFQVIYHSQMAEELGSFSFADVVDSVSNKMIRRHPHVFGDEEMRTAAEQTLAWEQIKAEERQQKGQAATGILDGILRHQPALMRADDIQSKAAKVGFDWPEMEPVFAKIQEEMDEIREAMEKNMSQQAIADEVGDLFFACVNLARRLNVDPELATQGTNNKFCKRFAYIEAEVEKQGKEVQNTPLAELDALWEEAKTHEQDKS